VCIPQDITHEGSDAIWKEREAQPRFIGPFEITQRVESLAYRVALPLNLVETHDVFHVSMLRKYIANPNVIVEYEPLGI
jgi:hypothetical protein